MRAVVQRVLSASVAVSGQEVSRIGHGLVVLLGVARTDEPTDAAYVASKVHGLRVFGDDEGRMNRSVAEVGGAVLAVSQFTLFGDARRGRRPSFVEAAEPGRARELYDAFVRELRTRAVSVAEGVFQADMKLSLVNDGPVTILVDSRKQF
jgi:D-tyrosyl-tRNA(Tyr) deacylase